MEGNSLTNELLRQSGCSVDTVTSAAFVQQRAKLLPAAFENLFHNFVSKTTTDHLFKGYRILFVDGSDIHIPTNRNDFDSLYQFEEGRKPYNLLHFHSKKAEFILQEIYARLIMYNFSEIITSQVIIEKRSRKYDYKVNFSVAVHICWEFFLDKVTPLDIEALIARFITPIRSSRSRPRNVSVRTSVSFIYRVA